MYAYNALVDFLACRWKARLAYVSKWRVSSLSHTCGVQLLGTFSTVFPQLRVHLGSLVLSITAELVELGLRLGAGGLGVFLELLCGAWDVIADLVRELGSVGFRLLLGDLWITASLVEVVSSTSKKSASTKSLGATCQ